MTERILPGTSVQTVAGAREAKNSVSGVVAMALPLPWGARMTELGPADDTVIPLGRRRSDPALRLVNEVLNYADKLILFRRNTGTKASGELASGLTAKAAYGGTRGNDITVTVTAAGESWEVKTFLDTVEMDSQTVTNAAGFAPNGLIALEGGGALAAATVKLTGGADGEPGGIEDFLQELPLHDYNLIAYTGTDAREVEALRGFLAEQRQPECCNMVQLVQSVAAADDPAVYRSTVGGKTAAYELTPAEACATMAGILARVGVENSATYFDGVAGWTDVAPRLTLQQQKARTKAGEILFVIKNGGARVLYDINSLTSFTADRPEDWRKGLVARTLDRYAADLRLLLDTRVIGYAGGKSGIRNNPDGRGRVKGMVVKMTVDNYLDKGYLESFSADDVTVEEGAARDAVNVTVGLRVADTVDKIYVTVISQ